MLGNKMFFDYNSIRQSRKVIIDASHGGDDTGVVVDGVSEKNLVLDISKYMYDRLRSLGVPVSITRDSDMTLTDDKRVDKILNTYGNSSDVIVISNHVDSDEDSAQIIYALRNSNSLANLIEKQLVSSGLNVKEPYQRRLPGDTSKDYYSIHRNTGVIQPVLIQYGNMSDYSDIQANYKKYVDAVVSAISSYLGINESDGDYYIDCFVIKQQNYDSGIIDSTVTISAYPINTDDYFNNCKLTSCFDGSGLTDITQIQNYHEIVSTSTDVIAVFRSTNITTIPDLEINSISCRLYSLPFFIKCSFRSCLHFKFVVKYY